MPAIFSFSVCIVYSIMNLLCIQVSRLLLISGANPNTRTAYLHNSTPLCIAAKHGHTDFLALLLEFGANANLAGMLSVICPNTMYCSSQQIHWFHKANICMLYNYVECLALLLEFGVNANLATKSYIYEHSSKLIGFTYQPYYPLSFTARIGGQCKS